ncbi:MAG: hypothetical protein AAB538_00595 [Patescibacteria group bacterium]|mgnify:CR=1 FL=1
MNFEAQMNIVKKWAGNYETGTGTFEDIIKNTLNAEYLRFAGAHPSIDTKKQSSFSTTASALDQQLATDVGRLLRAWESTGDYGADGRGTVWVWSKERLVNDFPKFFSLSNEDIGYPRVMAPDRYHPTTNKLIVHFDRVPDAAYTIYFEYYERITAIATITDSMVLDADSQLDVALRAARKLIPSDSEAFTQLNSILGLDVEEHNQAKEAGPQMSDAWQQDEVTTERRELLYTRLARG